MLGELFMDMTNQIIESPELLKELDKSIDDIENGRVTAHEETMKILTQRYNEFVSENSRNR